MSAARFPEASCWLWDRFEKVFESEMYLLDTLTAIGTPITVTLDIDKLAKGDLLCHRSVQACSSGVHLLVPV